MILNEFYGIKLPRDGAQARNSYPKIFYRFLKIMLIFLCF
jgi:hypothetical protein